MEVRRSMCLYYLICCLLFSCQLTAVFVSIFGFYMNMKSIKVAETWLLRNGTVCDEVCEESFLRLLRVTKALHVASPCLCFLALALLFYICFVEPLFAASQITPRIKIGIITGTLVVLSLSSTGTSLLILSVYTWPNFKALSRILRSGVDMPAKYYGTYGTILTITAVVTGSALFILVRELRFSRRVVSRVIAGLVHIQRTQREAMQEDNHMPAGCTCDARAISAQLQHCHLPSYDEVLHEVERSPIHPDLHPIRDLNQTDDVSASDVEMLPRLYTYEETQNPA